MAEHEANELRQLMEQDLRELALLVTGIGDAAAAQRQTPDAPSVKELLAVLSERIRARFAGLADVLDDPDHVLAAPHSLALPEKILAIVATCGTVTALITRCRADFEDLANLVAGVPTERLAAPVRVSAGKDETKVELLAWVRGVYTAEFRELLEQVRTRRGGART